MDGAVQDKEPQNLQLVSTMSVLYQEIDGDSVSHYKATELNEGGASIRKEMKAVNEEL